MSGTSTLDRAVELWRSERSAEGEALLRELVAKAEYNYGRSSLAYEVASGELGSFLWLVDRQREAVEVFRVLCGAPMPTDREMLQHRLTQITNFGDLLITGGHFNEAEIVLQEGLAARLQYYGRKHPGYAFGLEPLAAVWLYRGQFESALAAIDETIDNFASCEHERIVGALVLRAEILKTAGSKNYLFKYLEDNDAESIENFATKLFARVKNFTPPKIGRLLLLDLVQLLVDKFDRDHKILLSTYHQLAELERQLGEIGDPQIRQGSLQRILESYQRQGNFDGAISALMGLGLAQLDDREIDAANTSYRRALALAEEFQNPQLLVRVTRNYGLFLKQIGQKISACNMLSKSIELSKQHDLIEDAARGQVALGIFLQHDGNLKVAKNLLELGIVKLNPSDRDRLCGLNHLRALEHGSLCCNEGIPDTVLASCREFILSKLTPNTVNDLRIVYSEHDGLTVQVSFPDRIETKERELVSLQVSHAFREFHKNMTSS
jgi:tetratricopeptide (TPR) repeat protein